MQMKSIAKAFYAAQQTATHASTLSFYPLLS